MKIIDIETTDLQPTNGKIILFGVKNLGKPPTFYKEWEIGEKEVIKQSIKELERAKTIIGYNIVKFDLPFIIKRAEINGLTKEAKKLDEIFQKNKIENKIIDIYRSFGRGSLQFWAKNFDISIILPSINGSQIPMLYEKQEFDKILLHNNDDLNICEELYLRFGKF